MKTVRAGATSDSETVRFVVSPARPQLPLAVAAYDNWLDPAGDVIAQFHRLGPDYLVRFTDQADFTISGTDGSVSAVPARPGVAVDSLYHNAILPMIGNHFGKLHLHGSAVAGPAGALAFMGLSRSGKTTLAGAFAQAGHPFLTEDVLSLESTDRTYEVLPQRPVLRLFADSADFLFGEVRTGKPADALAKAEFAAAHHVPHAQDPARLAAIFLLGPGTASSITITRLAPAKALAQLIRQAFILDVEDQVRLRAHFERIANLAERVPCLLLDYPRQYAELPKVIAAVLQAAGQDE